MYIYIRFHKILFSSDLHVLMAEDGRADARTGGKMNGRTGGHGVNNIPPPVAEDN